MPLATQGLTDDTDVHPYCTIVPASKRTEGVSILLSLTRRKCESYSAKEENNGHIKAGELLSPSASSIRVPQRHSACATTSLENMGQRWKKI